MYKRYSPVWPSYHPAAPEHCCCNGGHRLGQADILKSGLRVVPSHRVMWQGRTDQGRIISPGNSEAAASRPRSNPAVLSILAAVQEAAPHTPAHLPPAPPIKAASSTQCQFRKVAVSARAPPAATAAADPQLAQTLPPDLHSQLPAALLHQPCSRTGTALKDDSSQP